MNQDDYLRLISSEGLRHTWGFVVPEISEIKGEIDLWTKEIEKKFRVIRAEKYEDVIEQIQSL